MRFFRILGAIVLVGLLLGLVAGIYQAGVVAGLAQGGTTGGAVAWPLFFGFGWHPFGFGIFGFLGSLFVLFLIFGLIRAIAFGGQARGWREAHRHGSWAGGPWSHGPGGMADGPWADRAREIHDEWHRRNDGPAGPSGGSRGPDGAASGPGTPAA